MHVIGIIFAVLGIGLQLRMLGWLIDSEMRRAMFANLASAPFANQMLFVGALLIPFAYYGACIYCCTTKRRRFGATVMLLSIVCAAVPYFYNLHATLPGVAKNAVWAGVFSLSIFFSRSNGVPDEKSVSSTGRSDKQSDAAWMAEHRFNRSCGPRGF